jgi:hypothetical protein
MVDPLNDNDDSTHLRLALRDFHHGLHLLTSDQGAATVTGTMQIRLKPRRVAAGVRRTPVQALSLAATG